MTSHSCGSWMARPSWSILPFLQRTVPCSMTGPVTVMTRPLITARYLSFFSAACDEDVPLLVVLVEVDEVAACDEDGPEADSPRGGRRRRGRASSVEGCDSERRAGFVSG